MVSLPNVRSKTSKFKVFTATALLGLLSVSLLLMSATIQNATQFNKLFSLLLIINLSGVLVLLVLLAISIGRLLIQYFNNTPGSRLTLKLVMVFGLITFTPGAVVYYFSLDFLRQGIDSWFDVKIDNALSDALALSRSALDHRMRELRKQTTAMAEEIRRSDQPLALLLNDFRDRSGASEIVLLAENGRLIASSSADATIIVPDLPNETLLLHVKQAQSYVGLDAIRDEGLHMRVLIYSSGSSVTNGRILQALYPVAQRLSNLAENVQTAFVDYQELSFMRPHLKNSLILTLSLVLLLSLLGAFWTAIYSARRLVEPIRDLAEGTRAVAAGDYDKKLPFPGNTELGFLVESFNDMTKRIALAHDQAKQSQQQAEDQRAYLAAVLGRLSTGVLTLDGDHTLNTVNAAASQILRVAMKMFVGQNLDHVQQTYPQLEALCTAISDNLKHRSQDWLQQLSIVRADGRQILMCRGTVLPWVADNPAGYVIVFDDITEQLHAQRESAWGEVARRLAHEIKNPLTPIQLSAERLRHKFLKNMPPADAKILERSTHTIVQQVEVMKEMVKAFTEYALAPQLKLTPMDVNNLIVDVLDLYNDNSAANPIKMILANNLPKIEADIGRMRQLLHNLIKNALESLHNEQDGNITISTQTCTTRLGQASNCVEICIADSGPGFPQQILDRLFEPYVTTKPKGSGLGLAIVKKIVEEHGGSVSADNLQPSGAKLTVRLPIVERQPQSFATLNEKTV